MDYTKLSLDNCFNLACTEFGLEDQHTICIGKLAEAVDAGLLLLDDATPMAQIIYHHGSENLYYNEDWDDEDEDGEYADWEYEDDFDDYDRDYEPDVDECGFDPYEGCYTGDC